MKLKNVEHPWPIPGGEPGETYPPDPGWPVAITMLLVMTAIFPIVMVIVLIGKVGSRLIKLKTKGIYELVKR